MRARATWWRGLAAVGRRATQRVGAAAQRHQRLVDVVTALAWLPVLLVWSVATWPGHVTAIGVTVLVAPAYLGLLWLMTRRDRYRDDTAYAVQVARSAHRKAQQALTQAAAISEHLESTEAPPTGRHAR